MIALLVIFIVIAAGVAAGLCMSANNAKSAQYLLNDAKKRLEKNPANIDALRLLSDHYYKEKNWAAARHYLEKLGEIGQKNSTIPLAQVTLRAGICAVMLEKYRDALKDLISSHTLDPLSDETNFNLGITYYRLGIFDKALSHLRKAQDFSPELDKWLALAYCNLGMVKEGLSHCSKAIEMFPRDSEVIFAHAQLLELSGSDDGALQFYEKLLAHNVFGSRACYHAGLLLRKKGRVPDAVSALEKSLSFSEFSNELFIQTSYTLGICYFEVNRINDGISSLKDVLSRIEEYKDTKTLIEKYSELAKNENLRVYLYGTAEEFERLIKKIVDEYFKDEGASEVTEITFLKDTVDCILLIKANKREKRMLLSFFRETGPVGELYIRDFNEKIHEMRCAWGVFFSSGTFLPSVQSFSENRSFDLLDKVKLDRLFNKLSTYS